jgi:hypothetical protein
MISFKQYIAEVINIVPAKTGIPEVLPHGFSIKEPSSKKPKKPKTNKPKVTPKNISFAERLRRAKELAAKK